MYGSMLDQLFTTHPTFQTKERGFTVKILRVRPDLRVLDSVVGGLR